LSLPAVPNDMLRREIDKKSGTGRANINSQHKKTGEKEDDAG
jgi:hypothetical protein